MRVIPILAWQNGLGDFAPVTWGGEGFGALERQEVGLGS